jgi:hypothetical protein
MRIRVTEVFRRIDGDWKMIHRHADAQKDEARRIAADIAELPA